jgi:hypothetical protein
MPNGLVAAQHLAFVAARIVSGIRKEFYTQPFGIQITNVQRQLFLPTH